jgi:Dockerin type I domain
MSVFNPRFYLLAIGATSIALSAAAPARAQAVSPDVLLLRDYRFVVPKSTVEETGGIGGVDKLLNVVGRFDLETGFKNPSGGPTPLVTDLVTTGKFTNVRGSLVDLRSATPVATGQSLDATLNLSGLDGEGSPGQLEFIGADGQGQALRLEATLTGRLLHLTGGTSDPLCCDLYRYKVDAWAHQLPWADFDGSGTVDATDYTIWQQYFGMTVDPGTDGDANGDGVVDATDYALWRSQLGQSDATLGGTSSVPEPGTLVMLILGAAPLGVLAGVLRRDNCTRAR